MLTILDYKSVVTIHGLLQSHDIVCKCMPDALSRCRMQTQRLVDHTVEVWKVQERAYIAVETNGKEFCANF